MVLFIYDLVDLSWSYLSQVDQVQNVVGWFGVVFVDILFMMFGYFVYFFLLLLGIKIWQVFCCCNLLWEWNIWLFFWCLVGLIFLILVGLVLVYIYFYVSGYMLVSVLVGGVIGQSLGCVVVDVLNVQGSMLVFFVLFFFGLMVFVDFFWFKVMDVIGKIILDFFELIQNVFNCWMGVCVECK